MSILLFDMQKKNPTPPQDEDYLIFADGSEFLLADGDNLNLAGE